MRTLLPNHPLSGQTVDFDWRPKKEQDQPYDFSNKAVTQNVKILEVRLDCHGTEWAYSENFAPQDVKRVCKVY